MAAEADASGGPLLVLTPQLRDAARRAAAEGRGEFLQFVREDAEALPLTRARGLAEWAGVPLHELLAGSRIKSAWGLGGRTLFGASRARYAAF